MMREQSLALMLLMCGLGGCVAVAPPLMAFPGKGKSYIAFQQDDARCRGAAAQVAAHPVRPPPGTFAQTPNLAYAQCMVASGNRAGPPPLPALPPEPYFPPGGGVYSGFGDTFPWEYGY